jgi:hypothetical protein
LDTSTIAVGPEAQNTEPAGYCNVTFAALIPGIIIKPPFCRNNVSPLDETEICWASDAGSP